MFLKICANTNLQDATLAVELGADAVGFVFAESKRRVTVEQVAAITPALPDHVEKAGVFTSTSAIEILDAADGAGLTMVQLHSAFDAQLVDVIYRASGGALKIVQVVDVAANADPSALHQALVPALQHHRLTAVLLDASHGGVSGGTGKSFDWKRMAPVVHQAQEETQGRIIIAGGLRPENVAEAITLFQPFGVDVASGVEASPGVKDAERMRAFIQAARAAR
jgi:phosphoribosylanthranilate isomerase